MATPFLALAAPLLVPLPSGPATLARPAFVPRLSEDPVYRPRLGYRPSVFTWGGPVAPPIGVEQVLEPVPVFVTNPCVTSLAS